MDKKKMIIVAITCLVLLGIAFAKNSGSTQGTSESSILAVGNAELEVIKNCQNVNYKEIDKVIINEEKAHTCTGEISTEGDITSCFEYVEENGTEQISLSVKYDSIDGNTIYWTNSYADWQEVDKTKEVCTDTGYRVEYSTSEAYTCDYSEWGKCSVDLENKRLVCDSKYDGNADGICQSGESCIWLDIDSRLAKDSTGLYDGLLKTGFDVRCQNE